MNASSRSNAHPNRIVRIRQEELQLSIPDARCDLLASGALDSLALVSLFQHVESELDVALDMDQLDHSDIATVESLSSFVARSCNGSNGTHR